MRSLSLLLLASVAAVAQTPALTWERVGEVEEVFAIQFEGDTLYVDSRDHGAFGAFALRPSEDRFSRAFPGQFSFKSILFLGSGVVVLRSSAGVGSGIYRTDDWFETGREVVSDAFSDPIALPSGTLLVGTRGNEDGNGSLALRSTDRGASWSFVGLGNNAGIGTESFVVVPATPDRPGGRVIAAGFNGIAVSDDDGQTWTPSSIYGVLGYDIRDSARIASTGRVLALVQGNGEGTEVMASEDDGETWASLGPVPGIGQFSSRLLAVPDGAVYLYEVYVDPNESQGRPVWRSLDGGATWHDMGQVWTEWTAVLTGMALGPDGRLYASARRGGSVFSPIRGGVFRTVAPVYAVAGEEAPDSARLGVRVYPNPTGSAVTVELELATSEHMTITVVDVQGRVVREIHRGGATDRQRFEIPAGLAPGAYVVRVASASGTATAGLTIVR